MAAAEVVTLTAPNGMQVSVAAEKQSRLLVNGYQPVEADGEKPPAKKPAAAKKAAAARSSDKK